MSVVNQSQTITNVLEVKGLDCPDCANLVQRSVESIPGVVKAEINFSAGKLRVIHHADKAPLQKIVQVLGQIGHPATIQSSGQPTKELTWWKQPRILFLGIAGFLTLFTLLATEVVHFEIPETIVRVLYSVAALIGVLYPAKSGWIALRQKRLTINTLLVVAVVGAIYLNLWEEAAGLVVIFSLGDVLNSRL